VARAAMEMTKMFRRLGVVVQLDLVMTHTSTFIVDMFSGVSRSETFYFLRLTFINICTNG
jgi:hypothetical protein